MIVNNYVSDYMKRRTTDSLLSVEDQDEMEDDFIELLNY